ncbi:hypothetical protein I5168_11985 [Nonlabens sp. SCSIO 43208]|uniref:hypothetical protein n=1 Tax=Nonlabens sp. SCSIO 43208 TaxID=2793009 RepID=UPI003D6AF9E2
MKVFTEIFKVDEVKKYVEMRDERLSFEISKVIYDSDKFKELSDYLIKESTKPIQEFYSETLQKGHMELAQFASIVILQQNENEREDFIKKYFPENQDFFLEELKHYNEKP